MNPCYECDLCNTRRNQVIDDPVERDIMVISSNPDAKSDRTGLPMSGETGKMLDEYLSIGNLHKGIVYKGYSVMCRPIKRSPYTNEIYSCRKNLKAVIDIVKPKIIVCLGHNPLVSIFNGESQLYSKLKGKPILVNGIIYFYTYDMNHIKHQPDYKQIAVRHWGIIANLYKQINPCHIC